MLELGDNNVAVPGRGASARDHHANSATAVPEAAEPAAIGRQFELLRGSPGNSGSPSVVGETPTGRIGRRRRRLALEWRKFSMLE